MPSDCMGDGQQGYGAAHDLDPEDAVVVMAHMPPQEGDSAPVRSGLLPMDCDGVSSPRGRQHLAAWQLLATCRAWEGDGADTP